MSNPFPTVGDITKSVGETPIQTQLESGGVTGEFLVRLAKEGLRAKEQKTFKMRGAVDPKTLARGYRVVAVSGRIIYDKDGNPMAGDGETTIEYHVKLHDVQQRTRSDVHKLKNDYPPERVKAEVETTVVLKHNIPDPKPVPEDLKK